MWPGRVRPFPGSVPSDMFPGSLLCVSQRPLVRRWKGKAISGTTSQDKSGSAASQEDGGRGSTRSGRTPRSVKRVKQRQQGLSELEGQRHFLGRSAGGYPAGSPRSVCFTCWVPGPLYPWDDSRVLPATGGGLLGDLSSAATHMRDTHHPFFKAWAAWSLA